MASDPEFEEFANFVASQHSRLRPDAVRLVGNESLAHTLMLRALSEVASRWRYASRVGPQEVLSQQLETQARGFWRENVGGHEVPTETEATAPQLARQAWTRGLRARRRRVVGRALIASVVVVLVVAYGLSVAFDSDAPAERTHHAEMATPVSDTVAVVPPPGITDSAPQYQDTFDNAATPTVGTPWLQDDPVTRIAAIVYGSSQSPVVIGQDGQQRRFDVGAAQDTATLVHPRSVSPDGLRAALTPNEELAILSTEGSLDIVDLQDDIGIIYDVAWLGERVQVTTSTGSYVVDIGSGVADERQWYGPDSTYLASAGDDSVAEFVTTDSNPLVIQTWKGDKKAATASATARELQVSQWRSVPFNHRNEFARGCIVADSVDVPADYGSPGACIAVVDADTSLQRMLVLTDKYGGSSQLLGFADGKVFFTIDPPSTNPVTVMVWQPDSNRLNQLFPLKNKQMVALGKI